MSVKDFKGKSGLVLLIAITIIAIGACKTTQPLTKAELLDSEKQWPCYKLTKDELKEYFKDDGTPNTDAKKILLNVSIDDYEDGDGTMTLWRTNAKTQNEFGEGHNSIRLTTDGDITTKSFANVILSTSEIKLTTLKSILFRMGAWTPEFHHIRLTPKKGKNHTHCLVFKITLHKANGADIDLPGAHDEIEYESNPIPPGRPSEQ